MQLHTFRHICRHYQVTEGYTSVLLLVQPHLSTWSDLQPLSQYQRGVVSL